MTLSTTMHASKFASKWASVLAGTSYNLDIFDPQPCAVGFLTACQTAEAVECDARVEHIASSQGFFPRVCPVDASWHPDGFPRGPIACDELDALLEELARDASCPYLRELTVPSLITDPVTQPWDYGPAAAATAAAGPATGTIFIKPSGLADREWMLGLEPLPRCSIVDAQHTHAAHAQHAKAAWTSMLLSYSDSISGSRAEIAVQCSSMAAGAAEAAVTGDTQPCSPPFAAVLAAIEGSGSGSSSGVAWADSGDAHVAPHGLMFLSQGTRRRSRRALTSRNVQPGAGACAINSAPGGTGGDQGCRCVPEESVQEPYNCRQRCVYGGGVQIHAENMVSTGKGGYTDQPAAKGTQQQELWLSRGLRRLRSFVRMRGSSGSPSRPGITAAAADTAAAAAAAATAEAAAAGATITQSLSPPRRPATAHCGAATAVTTAGLPHHNAGRTSNRSRCNRGGDGTSGEAPAAVMPAATEALKSQVMLFTARLRGIQTARRKSQ
ncbi:hypothetical protein VOLCADRAFT_97326 [Volvox carteri f. nagariensis]|uniref:Uncharacterized protein n=1 Tax=Volvox carteri f. nagariensis TaxID=3068 RepID=D8UCG6_VOLCA|nr:uncharacterized protein VOLCADRAFT_97326 [Volvox carteri f. nagariensis]EFJ42489.1 hypothetical protein VOLCADRAFT_97326 [Volvox carteri f. nagariensis]|eukprot:XP_002956345.1 hypothetical protein VOLCADRAFT_97326 [Volvox carteri f. nagariensis]